MPGQLVLPFEVPSALGVEHFIVTTSNEAAFRMVTSWPDWPAPAAALHGPEGSGKSHLGRIWSARAGAAQLTAAELTEETLAPLAADAAVLIEDVDSAQATLQRDRGLFALLERKSGFALLTGRAPPADWPVALSDVRSRFAAMLAFPVWAPDDMLLSSLARKLFADRQLQVGDAVIRRILVTAERTPRAISGFVAELDRRSLAERRPVTERLVLDLLEDLEGGR